MITLVTEPRQNLFGRLCEWGVDRSAAGKAVYDAWQEIEINFPGVRATYNAIMPDHFHGILYFTADGIADLDEVVQSFAASVERRVGYRLWQSVYRESICLARGQLHRQIAYVLSNARRRWVKERNPELFKKALGFRHWRLRRASEACASVGSADEWAFWRFARDPESECWPLAGEEEIEKPRRANRRQMAFCDGAWAKDVKPTTTSGLAVTPIDWVAIGNPFLLDAPLLISVSISTVVPSDVLARLVARIREKTSRGAVVVSPFVSPGEKTVKEAVLADGGAVVQLMAEGFGRYYKPGGRDFEFCAAGQLLQLSPFQPQQGGAVEREHCSKPRFEWLNLAADSIADLAIGWKRGDPVNGQGKGQQAHDNKEG